MRSGCGPPASGRHTVTSAPQPRRREGGWESLGDVGWLDEDNYLYLGDRLEDMILTGGANVYPAEVEAALQEHPAVGSVVVIGLPDDDLGNVVHAIVEADPRAVPPNDLLAFVGDRLARYKVRARSNTPIRPCATKRARYAGTPCAPIVSLRRLQTTELAQEGPNAATNPTKAKRSVPAVTRRKRLAVCGMSAS